MNNNKFSTIYSISASNTQLGYYLAGLIEGDGNIWTPISKTERIYNPQIMFTFHKNEKPLFEKLKKLLNTGSLYQEKLNNSCKYRISKTEQLLLVINLINGKFRTPKIKDLYRAIDHLNMTKGINIEKLPLDENNIESNAWLAGFTDADGHFQISLEGCYSLNCFSKKRGRVKCTFSVKQRLMDKRLNESCLPFMSEIASYFKCNIKYESNNEITFKAQADSKHYLTKNYFDNYPLLTSKYHNYRCFLQGLNYLGRRLTEQEIVEIQNIKNSMNNKRKIFNWDHLDLLKD